MWLWGGAVPDIVLQSTPWVIRIQPPRTPLAAAHADDEVGLQHWEVMFSHQHNVFSTPEYNLVLS